MGAEQSSSDRREKVTQNDVQRALEAQRKMYEQRCRQLLAAQAQATSRQPVNSQAQNATLQPTNVPRSSTERNEPRLSMAPPRPTPPLSRPSPVPFARNSQNSPVNNINNSLANQNCLERDRTPYNLGHDELQNTVEITSRMKLYPDLNMNQPSTSSDSSPSNNNFRNTQNNRPKEFVFVNNRGQVEKFKPSAPPRDASRSRDRSGGDDELKCPTCGNLFSLYIFNCQSGHSSCKTCKEHGAACGVCRQNITDMRNITLEAYVAERKVPCLNKTDGCNLFIKLADMESHVKECPFKELACPLNSLTGYCHWRGKLNHLSKHFDSLHSAQRQAEEDKEMYLPNINSNKKFVYLIVKGNFNFLFHVWVSESDRVIYMTTQLIGTKYSAQKWTYEVHVYNKREPRRKYQYSDSCNAAIENVGDIFKEARCAAIPVSYALNYVNEGAMCFKFFISKPFQARGNYQNKNQRGRGGKRQN